MYVHVLGHVCALLLSGPVVWCNTCIIVILVCCWQPGRAPAIDQFVHYALCTLELIIIDSAVVARMQEQRLRSAGMSFPTQRSWRHVLHALLRLTT